MRPYRSTTDREARRVCLRWLKRKIQRGIVNSMVEWREHRITTDDACDAVVAFSARLMEKVLPSFCERTSGAFHHLKLMLPGVLPSAVIVDDVMGPTTPEQREATVRWFRERLPR